MTLFRNRIAFLMALSRIRDIVVEGVAPISITGAQKDSLGELVAFGGTYQGNLPQGYTQLEYIASSGTQYIDTGITNENCDNYGVKTKYNYTSSSANSLCGNYATGFPASFGQIYLNGGRSSIYSGSGNVERCVVSSGVTTGVDYTDEYYIDCTTGNITRNFNGSELTGSGLSFSTRSSANCLLFACNTSGGASQKGSEKIYYFQMLKDGVLVRNFIPAKRNSDSVLGMYDTVSGNFYTNDGTGTFTAGGEAVPSPDTPMDIVCNNGVVKANTPTSGKNAINTSDMQNGYLIGTVGSAPTINNSSASMVIKSAIKVSAGKSYKFSYISNIPGNREVDVVGSDGKVKQVAGLSCSVGLNEYTITANYDGELWLTVQQGTLEDVNPICYEIGQIYADDNIETLLVTQLPAGYIPLEYIESSGTQYIDTGIKADSDYDVDITFGTLNSLSNGSVFGNQGSDILFYCLTGANTYIRFYNDNADKGGLNPALSTNTKYTTKLSVSGTSASITGGLTGSFSGLTIPGTYNILLNANHNAVGTIRDIGSFKYYAVKITKNGTVVFNGVPAKRNSDNAIGMFDTVSQTFFANDGTGDFIAGPIKTHGKNLATVFQLGSLGPSGDITTTNTRAANTDLIPVNPGDTYTFSVDGTDYVIYECCGFDANKQFLRYIFSGANVAAQTQAMSNDVYYVRYTVRKTDNSVINLTDFTTQLEEGSAATTYEPYRSYVATCEPLFKIGTYQDVQSIIDGVVTRNVGVKVFDGTENWTFVSDPNKFLVYISISDSNTDRVASCTHFRYVASTNVVDQVNLTCFHLGGIAHNKNLMFRYDALTSLQDWKDFLADQYNAGTPVIIIYPLATETTESVTGQTVNLEAGDGSIDIIQAAIDGLSLRAKYKRG